MIPDYQTLMRPVLTCAATGETRIGDVVEQLADKLNLTTEERAQLLPSGKQTRFANRVNWAKVAGVNYLGRSTTTILAGGGGEVLLSS